MTDEQPPNCGNCPYQCYYPDKDIKNFICLFHPDTKAWMMKDVVKELERRADMFGGEYAIAYRTAILLIKGDGK